MGAITGVISTEKKYFGTLKEAREWGKLMKKKVEVFRVSINIEIEEI